MKKLFIFLSLPFLVQVAYSAQTKLSYQPARGIKPKPLHTALVAPSYKRLTVEPSINSAVCNKNMRIKQRVQENLKAKQQVRKKLKICTCTLIAATIGVTWAMQRALTAYYS